jgi:iron complex transport system ATP-binding protein
MLIAEHVSLAIDGATLVRDVSVRVEPGRVVAIMGPNGAGKTTLLRMLAGDLTPDSGTVTLDGRPMAAIATAERARRRAVVPQRSSIAFGFTVLETVLLGRYPHGGDNARATDIRIARKALARSGVSEFEARLAPTLSGGELARVILARALAQIDGEGNARYLLLDEPTGALDPAHQHHVLRLLRAMARESNVGVLIILHDLNLAARYADEVVLMRSGRVTTRGSADQALTPAMIAATFDVDAIVVAHPTGSTPIIVVNG